MRWVCSASPCAVWEKGSSPQGQDPRSPGCLAQDEHGRSTAAGADSLLWRRHAQVQLRLVDSGHQCLRQGTFSYFPGTVISQPPRKIQPHYHWIQVGNSEILRYFLGLLVTMAENDVRMERLSNRLDGVDKNINGLKLAKKIDDLADIVLSMSNNQAATPVEQGEAQSALDNQGCRDTRGDPIG